MYLAISGDLCSGKKLLAEWLKLKHNYQLHDLKQQLRTKLNDPLADYYSPKYADARKEIFSHVTNTLISDICSKHIIYPIVDLNEFKALKM